MYIFRKSGERFRREILTPYKNYPFPSRANTRTDEKKKVTYNTTGYPIPCEHKNRQPSRANNMTDRGIACDVLAVVNDFANVAQDT